MIFHDHFKTYITKRADLFGLDFSFELVKIFILFKDFFILLAQIFPFPLCSKQHLAGLACAALTATLAPPRYGDVMLKESLCVMPVAST